MQVFELPDPTLHPEAIGFSPDGRRLALWAFGRVFVLDTRTGVVRTVRAESDWIGYGTPEVGFTADGSGLIAQHYLASNESAVRVYDPDTGAVQRALLDRRIEAMALGPGGRLAFVALSPGPGVVEVVPWDPATGEQERAFGRFKGFLRHLAVSADGNWVAGSAKNVIRVWNLSGGKLPTRATRQIEADRWVWLTGLALAADGSFVAAGGGGVAVWDVRTGKGVKPEQYGTARGRQCAFHPTHPVLGYARGEGAVFWEVPSAKSEGFAPGGIELARYDWGLSEPQAICFAPDGLRCAVAGKGKVVVWDVDV